MNSGVLTDNRTARPFPFKLFAFAFFGWAFDFYDLVLLGFIKGPVGHDLGLTESQEAWMVGVALGASGLGGIVSGALADRFGKRSVLAGTILMYSAGSLVCGLAPTAAVFLAGRALVGLGVGGEWAIGHSMVAEAVADDKRGRASSWLQAGEPVGVALAALAGYVLMPLFGWRAILVGSSVTALLAMAARRSLHLPDEKAPKQVTLQDLERAKVGPRMAMAWVLGVFKLGTYWTCYTWLPTFLQKDMHQSTGKSIAWVLTAQVGQLLGMLSFGYVSDKIGRRFAFSTYSVLTACAIFPLATRWEYLSANPGLFWLTMFFLGVGSGCTAGFGALLAELFPTEVRGMAMGAVYNCARTAQLGAPVLVRFAVLSYGLKGGLSVPLVLALATASWVWVLPETRGIPLPKLADAADAAGGAGGASEPEGSSASI